MDNQRKNIMATLRELVSSGKDVKDVEYFINLDKTVSAKGTSMEEVAELNSNLNVLDMRRGEVGSLVKLSRVLIDRNLSHHSICLDETGSRTGRSGIY